MKRKLSVLLIMAMIIVSAFSSYAAATYSDAWKQSSDGNWCVHGSDGKMITNAWFCDDAVPENGKEVWYLIDSDGHMIAAGL